MMPIHLQTSGADSISEAFLEALTELPYQMKRDHRLLILSCYIDFSAIEMLIKKTKRKVRLTEVHLAFEYMEAFRRQLPNATLIKLQKLKKWCAKYEIDFGWDALRAGALMHAKGYTVFQPMSGQRGIVCIGSGNATFPGLGVGPKERTNVELVYISSEDDDIEQFLAVWNELLESRRDLEKPSEREDVYSFAYELLASGKFLHEWRDTMSSQTRITYTLTAEAQQQNAQGSDWELDGFKFGQSTASRDPLSEIDFGKLHALPSSFLKRFTIDTFLGRWCPHSIWNVVQERISKNTEFKEFQKSFRDLTESENLARIIRAELEIYNRRLNNGSIVADPHCINRWENRIEGLRNNEQKLMRIFLKLSDFDFPYYYENTSDVQELYESLLETIDTKKYLSFVAKKVSKAKEGRKLSALELNADEQTMLRNFLEQN